jgi:hypothetical protein
VEIVIGGDVVRGEFAADRDRIVKVWAPNAETRSTPQGNSPAIVVARRLLHLCYADFANPTAAGGGGETSRDPAAHFPRPPYRVDPRSNGRGFDGWLVGQRKLPGDGGTASAYVDTAGYVRLVCIGPQGRRDEREVLETLVSSWDAFDMLISRLNLKAELESPISEVADVLGDAFDQWPLLSERLPPRYPDDTG